MAHKTLVTTFDDVHEAERAVFKLHEDGFPREALGWVSHAKNGREIAHGNLVERRTPAIEGAIEGVIVGGAFGGIAGLLIGVSALVIPGVGPVVVAGPLVSTLAGIGVGAAAGALIDSLTRVGVPREQAHRYAERVRAGGAIVMVTVENDEEEARALEILGNEAALHKHQLVWNVPASAEEPRRWSRFSLW